MLPIRKLKLRIYCASVLAAVALLMQAPLNAATAVLTLTVSGTIAPTPVWQDGSSVNITTVSFSYAGQIANGTPATNVDSATATVKLVNATAYPASVALVRPTGCAIGATSVTDANVHFLDNGTPRTTNTTISLTTNGNQSYAVRFASAGNYGDKSGAVSCSGNGSLTYTY